MNTIIAWLTAGDLRTDGAANEAAIRAALLHLLHDPSALVRSWAVVSACLPCLLDSAAALPAGWDKRSAPPIDGSH